jgi:hypothetical protein
MTTYFASFVVQSKRGYAWGNGAFSVESPIASIDQIRDQESALLEEMKRQRPESGYEELTILSWQPIASNSSPPS